MAMMFSGLTVANIVGVPLGTWLGHVASWRLSFALVAVAAGAAAWCLRRWMPALPPEPAAALTDSLRSFLRPAFWCIVGVSAIGTGGIFAWISYIAPMMTGVAGLAPAHVSWVMVLAGAGMAVGNWAGGRLSDRLGPWQATWRLLLAMSVTAVAVGLTASHLAVALVMTFVAGAVSFAVVAPLQALMIRHAQGSAMLASALVQSTSNLANALGAYLGGLAIAAGWGYTSPQYVGAAMAFVGVLCCAAIPRLGGRR
jgi:DHA1 family arabinose polymer transporter-like MFS transporter